MAVASCSRPLTRDHDNAGPNRERSHAAHEAGPIEPRRPNATRGKPSASSAVSVSEPIRGSPEQRRLLAEKAKGIDPEVLKQIITVVKSEGFHVSSPNAISDRHLLA